MGVCLKLNINFSMDMFGTFASLRPYFGGCHISSNKAMCFVVVRAWCSVFEALLICECHRSERFACCELLPSGVCSKVNSSIGLPIQWL